MNSLVNLGDVIECAPCSSKALCKKVADATAWVAHHARESGHYGNFRVQPFDPATIRGRVWWHRERHRWLWAVAQPGLTVAWGDPIKRVDALRQCGAAVDIYRRHPITWAAEEDDHDREDAR